MLAVVIVILVVAFVVVVCAVGVETLRRINRPSIAPLAPTKAEVQSWHITRAFGNDSQSVEIANLWFRLSEVTREELLFYGRGLVLPSDNVEPVRMVRASGVMTKVNSVDAEADRATTLTPVSIDLVEDELARPSKRPTVAVDMPRATVVEFGSKCAICETLIGRNESQASDSHGVTWHSKCLSQVGKRNKDRSGASQQ